jgi:hypothetical protein
VGFLLGRMVGCSDASTHPTLTLKQFFWTIIKPFQALYSLENTASPDNSPSFR